MGFDTPSVLLSTRATSTIILGIVRHDIGIFFVDAECLVSILFGIVTDISHVGIVTTRIILCGTEMSLGITLGSGFVVGGGGLLWCVDRKATFIRSLLLSFLQAFDVIGVKRNVH